jgi:hypothetical protein
MSVDGTPIASMQKDPNTTYRYLLSIDCSPDQSPVEDEIYQD